MDVLGGEYSNAGHDPCSSDDPGRTTLNGGGGEGMRNPSRREAFSFRR